MSDEINPVRLPERAILPPPTISPEAQANLSLMASVGRAPWPPAASISAWRAVIVQREEMLEPNVEEILAKGVSPVTDVEIAGVPCSIARPEGWDEVTGAIYLYFHGGAFVFGGGRYPRARAVACADALGVACVSVDYRMAPDHPYPAAPQDCLAVYRALLELYTPERIVIGGSSAGGNLAAATTLMIRDQGLPLPAGVVLLTPEVDLTESGDTFETNILLDVVLRGSLSECNALYAGDTPLDDPYVSPLLADLAGFPPTFIQSGTRDLFLSNSVLFHRKLRALGIRADLHVWEAMPHGGFGGATPEDAELQAEIGRFIASL